MPPPSPVLALPGTAAHVLSAPDGSIVLRLSSGRFLRVQEPPVNLREALADENQRTGGTAEFVQTLQDAVAARETADAEARWPSQRRRVGIVGEGRIIDGVAAALREWGFAPLRFETAREFLEDGERCVQDIGTDFSLVIAYADTPRDRIGWDRVDELPRWGCAWLRAYREGQICFVDPLSISGDDPSSEQVLRRRFAATATPGPFSAWHEAVAHAEPPTISAQSLTTGRMLTAALTWAREGEATGSLRSTLWRFVPATGEISEHTVLGYDTPYLPSTTLIGR